jgi:hypothetical protein
MMTMTYSDVILKISNRPKAEQICLVWQWINEGKINKGVFVRILENWELQKWPG